MVLNLLARREHSQEELRRKLLHKGIASADIELVLTECLAQGWQSDQRFAQEYVQMRMRKGYGPLRIHAELNERGVDHSLIDQCLIPYENEWYGCLTKLWGKKFAKHPSVDANMRMKQMRFLQQRGFEITQIQRFLRSKIRN